MIHLADGAEPVEGVIGQADVEHWCGAKQDLRPAPVMSSANLDELPTAPNAVLMLERERLATGGQTFSHAHAAA